jgi:hypothetical protein
LNSDIGIKKRLQALEKARLSGMIREPLGDLLGKRAEHADKKVGDLDALRQCQIIVHVGVEDLAIVLPQYPCEAQQLGGFAGAAIAGKQIGAGAIGKINLVGQLLYRVAIGRAMQALHVFVFAQALGHQFFLAKIDWRVEIQRM